MIYDETALMDDRIGATLEIDEKMTNLNGLNNMLSGYADAGVFVEFKTCQKTIKTGQEKYPLRKGHFVMDFEKHRQHILNRGYYFFIVTENGKVIRWKVIDASDLYFQKRIMWDRLFME